MTSALLERANDGRIDQAGYRLSGCLIDSSQGTVCDANATKDRRREDGQSAPDPIRATTTMAPMHGCDLETLSVRSLQLRHPS